ncbi:MAG: rcc01693 family protein [Rhodobacterales bacterium]
MHQLDWPGLMRAGLRGLRLQPAQFWALTPAELALMLGRDAGQAPMGRHALDRLMQAYPDPAKPSDEGMIQ